MAQILNTPTAAQINTQQFTDPIMQSLQNLTSMQLNSINQQKERANTMAGLSALMPKEQANMMSYLPQDLLKMLVPQMQKEQLAKRKTEEIIKQNRLLSGEGGAENGEGGGMSAANKVFENSMRLGGDVNLATRTKDNALKREALLKKEAKKKKSEIPSRENLLLNLKKEYNKTQVDKKFEWDGFLADKKSSFSDVEKKIITTHNAKDDGVAAYFLNIAGGNVDKAKKLARKFGMR